MSMYKELLYENNVSKVRGVQFGIMSPEDILQRSVVEITRTDTYAGNEPCDNGLFDVRMGTMELGKTCATCEQTNVFCPGHFGHVVLAKPVFYVKFLPVVIDILRCVCFRCSKLLVDANSPEVRALQSKRCARQKRWDTMTKLCQKVKTCPCCKERQPDRIKDNESTLIKMEWRDAENNVSADLVLSAEEVLRVFKRITEEDGEVLGFSSRFNRPEWLICTVLPVPPPAVRPSVRNDTGHRSEDDLTHILSDIVKFNNVLRGKIEKGASFDTVMYNTMMLQYHVATLVDNSAPTMYVTSKDRTGRQLRTLVDRLKSKEGRIRGNLMGKRVDFSARTVITPDPNLSIDELGVPMQIAMNLTFPEIVSTSNLEEMRQLVKNGPDRYPGAKHVRKAQQGMRTVRLKGNTRPNLEDLVEVGDLVERHLRNGDYVLFNRQPSLHKMSMMAHRVRVMPYKTFRLNVCVCSSYNADFDGDEMNMHLPQSLQTHEEIRHLAAVPLHVISPRHGKPIITVVQDVTLGVHRMTRPQAQISRRQFMNLTCSNPTYAGLLPPPPSSDTKDSREIETLSGRELLSTVIPRNTNVALGGVNIKDGVIGPSSNALTSKTFSTPSSGLVHTVYADKGPDAFTTFMNNTQKLVCDWLVLSGFSVGVADLMLDPEVKTKIKHIMTGMKDAVYEKIQDVHNNRFENLGTRSNAEFFEAEVRNIMNTGQKDAEKAAIESFKGVENRMLNMIDAGSKGKSVNFSQMVSSVGQQIVDEKRVTDGYDNRTLPHFTKFDDGPSSRGFVENSFIDGLSPHEFFFHAMGGRIGLIDTAVRSVTWDTPIVVVENENRCKRVLIGEWIDALLAQESVKDDVRRFPEDRDLEMLDLVHKVMIPTVDAQGKATWGRVTSVTRHDPSDVLYRVKTRSGREVTVADSESLLVWCEETQTFEKTHSRSVKIGDRMPVLNRELAEEIEYLQKDASSINDVVLDPVEIINEVAPAAESKLYDVTVPSTLNFVLANGLGVRDTSETGYIQRKLVKSMEDCKVHHDYTVRNAAGQIVQFLYGEDGADSAKLEYHNLPYLEMDDEGPFRETYLLAHTNELRPYVQPEVLDAVDEGAFQNAMLRHYEQLHYDRRFVQEMAHRKREHRHVVFPINVMRIVQNTAQVMDTYGCAAHLSDLDPMYVLEQIAALENDLTVGVTTRKTRVPLLGVLLRCFLSPKPLLTKHRLHRIGFDRVVQAIRASFYASLVNPGEVVGITAAQSIGEPTTQLSSLFSSRIHAVRSGSRTNDASEMYCGPIGKFIDDILAAHPDRVVNLGGDSVVLDLVPESGMDYHIVGVSDQEKTSWKRISQISRHPANGGMVRVHTKSGKSTCATLSHSFLKRTPDGIAPIKGHDLKIGDRVPVAQNIPSVPDPLNVIDIGGVPYELTQDLGWFIGAYLADGSISGNTISISKIIPEYQDKLRIILQDVFGKDISQRTRQGMKSLQGWDMSAYHQTQNYFNHADLARFLIDHFNGGSFRKRVAPFVYASNLDFIRGVIGGYFDGDGNVGTGHAKSTVRSASVSEELTEDFILLLAHVGIFACKCREKHVKEQGRNDLFTIQVLRKFAPKFRDEIGFVVRSKAQALDALVDYVQREDAHNRKDETDMIPELGDTLAFVGKTLQLEGQSRLYGRFTKKEAIGRETLRKAVETFDQEAFTMAVEADEVRDSNARKLRSLQELCDSAVPDSKGRIPLTEEAARDLADVGESVKEKGKKPGGEHVRAARDTRIHMDVLRRLINQMTPDNETKRQSVIDAVDAVEPHMTVLRQALEADVVWDEIVALEHLPDPGEMVYDFTVPGNDSFMVDCGVLVHNTLNSVHYDEELLLAVDGKLKRVKIGDFTHDVMNRAAPDAIEHHPQDAEFAWVRNEDVKVLAVDEFGRVNWQTVEAVTHHPVINEDGSDTLLHVRTRTGREVRATRGESFLKREDNKIVRLKGSDLRVGDRLPVSTVLPTRDVAAVDHLRVEDYLHPSEWLYMSHVEAALRVRENERIGWFKNLSSHGVYIPYSRGDALLEAFIGTEKKPPKRKHSTRPGCVYPATTSIKKDEDMQHLPERIPLDADFGFLVGAYLADGCIAIGGNKKDAAKRPYAVLICNMSQEFRARFVSFCQRYNIGYHIDAGTRLMKSGNRSPTVSLRMHSLLMGELFIRLFGQGADVKRIDPVLFGAPDEFLLALLDGYWSGNGSVSKTMHTMHAYSVSKGMLQDVQQIMVRFGIPTSMTQMSEQTHETTLKKHDTCIRGWTLYIPACGCSRFRELIDLTLQRKRQRLENMGDIDSTHAVYDKVPDVKLSTGTTTVSRSRIPFMLAGTTHEGDREILQRISDENIFYDEVIEIKNVPNADRDRVYDLTVANAHTFAVLNGLMNGNTFHLAGSANAASGTITQGVPRLRELLNVSKNIKTPAMEIAVKKEFATDKAKCAEIMNGIQTARFRDLVKASRIYYDPSDDADHTFIEEDRELLRLHAHYADFLGTCDKRKSPWLLRFEFDHTEMLKLNVMFTDIDFALSDHYDDELSCIFSDDNSSSLVCRVRLNISDNMDRNDILTEVMALEQSILENVKIKGVKDIEKAVLKKPNEINKVYDEVAGKFVNRQEWKIDTAGTNLVDVMANPFVDYTKTYTNDVVEVLRVLGIEAARTALYDEIRNVMWMTDTENVNYRHMALLVDTITNRGHLVSIDRHGINKGDIGPLAKCSFEETDKMLIKAGLFCELDKINGVSANIMLGQVPPCGTGDGDVIMDIDTIAENVEPKDVDQRYRHQDPTADREKEDEEAIQAAATSSSSMAADISSRSRFRVPDKDASIVEKKEDDIVIV